MACGRYTALVTLLCLLSMRKCVDGVNPHRRESDSFKQEKVEPDETSHTSTFIPSVRPMVESSDRECLEFQHTYCNSQFGYTHGLFPNHKGQTAQQAAEEFNHFTQLIHSGCSDKLGIFLCFTYFPFCTPTTDRVQEILPCKETCEEVHKSECTDYVVNATKGDGWASHLNCDQDIFKPMDSMQCATGESNGGKATTNRGGSQDRICEELDRECQSKCAVRASCNRGTFKSSKNAYMFAARVSIASRIESNQSCKHAYSVYVEQQFNLLSHQPTTNELSEAPVLLNGSIIHTSSSNCEECPGLTVGSTYLIAGQYHTNGDGTTVWELPNGKSSSLASKWQDKYSRKLQEWIDDANDVRRQGI